MAGMRMRLLVLAVVAGLVGGLNCGSASGGQYRKADIDAAIKKLESPDEGERTSGAYHLSEMGVEARDAVPALIKILEKKDEFDNVCGEAANALANIGPSAEVAIPALIAFLKSQKAGLERSYAASALGKIGKQPEVCVPILIEALKQDEEQHVRCSAAYSLGEFGSKSTSAIPALIKAIKEGDKDFRESATRGLSDIPCTAKEVAALTELLSDEIDEVRRAAANSLAGAGAEAAPAVPALIGLLEDKDSHIRAATAITLGRIGSGARAAMPALTKASKDVDPWVEQQAKHALELIRGK